MKAEKFLAPDAASALRQIRAKLGADAVILSNRPANSGSGVEIIAMSEADLSALTDGSQSSANATAPNPGMGQANALMQSVAGEMKSLRSLLEEQLAGLTLNDAERRDPVKASVWRTILNLGFSPALLRKLFEHLPNECDQAKALRWVRSALARNIRTPDEAIIERGGFYAFLGPTGVGKTTTVAKLAARCSMANGPGSVALVTLDNYRIGAFEQLRIYADIIGAPIYAVKDRAQLVDTLDKLSSRHLVLIDTAGMNQHDLRLADQVGLLCGDGLAVKRVLVVSATAQGSTLEDVLRGFGERDLFGCVLTKLDESVALGAVLDVMIRHRLAVLYVTQGQRVPEDIGKADVASLLDRVFKTPQRGAFCLRGNEFPSAP